MGYFFFFTSLGQTLALSLSKETKPTFDFYSSDDEAFDDDKARSLSLYLPIPTFSHEELELKLSDLLQQCTFKQFKQIHTFIITTPICRSNKILLRFLQRSTEVGTIEYSNLIFSQIGGIYVRDITLWNAMIRGYAYNVCKQVFDGMLERDVVRVGDVKNARGLFERMLEKNIVSLKHNQMVALDLFVASDCSNI
ncbi:hypothetical protein LguiB_016530 [Lonicera macranthoides]